MTKKQKELIRILKIEAKEIIYLIKEFEKKHPNRFNKTQFGNKRYYEGVLSVCERLNQC